MASEGSERVYITTRHVGDRANWGRTIAITKTKEKTTSWGELL